MNPDAIPRLASAGLLAVALFALAGCVGPQLKPQQHAQDGGAIVGDFCWSKYPLLQADKSCAPPAEAALAQEACTRTALEALTHPYAAKRDWFGMCMARHGLSRLGKDK